MTLNATPTTLTAVLASGQRTITLDPGVYDSITLRADVPMVTLNGSGPGTVLGGVHIIGQAQGVTLNNLKVTGDGIQSVDGVSHLSLSGVQVEDVPGVGINVTGYDTQPVLNLSLSGCRVRRCRIGVMIGQCVRGNVYDLWVDDCKSPTTPSDPAYHGVYLNDDCAVGLDLHGVFVSRCPGTSFRGTGSRAYDCVAYQCGGSIAGGRNCEMLTRVTSLDAGAIEIGAQGPCVVEDAAGSIQVKSTCRSPWLQILRPLYPSGGGLSGGGIYPLPDQDVPGRLGTLTVTDAGGLDITRTPETFCRDVLGGTPSLDDLWARPFSVAAMNRYLRGTA